MAAVNILHSKEPVRVEDVVRILSKSIGLDKFNVSGPVPKASRSNGEKPAILVFDINYANALEIAQKRDPELSGADLYGPGKVYFKIRFDDYNADDRATAEGQVFTIVSEKPLSGETYVSLEQKLHLVKLR